MLLFSNKEQAETAEVVTSKQGKRAEEKSKRVPTCTHQPENEDHAGSFPRSAPARWPSEAGQLQRNLQKQACRSHHFSNRVWCGSAQAMPFGQKATMQALWRKLLPLWPLSKHLLSQSSSRKSCQQKSSGLRLLGFLYKYLFVRDRLNNQYFPSS